MKQMFHITQWLLLDLNARDSLAFKDREYLIVPVGMIISTPRGLTIALPVTSSTCAPVATATTATNCRHNGKVGLRRKSESGEEGRERAEFCSD
jgi:hypothetical protein